MYVEISEADMTLIDQGLTDNCIKLLQVHVDYMGISLHILVKLEMMHCFNIKQITHMDNAQYDVYTYFFPEKTNHHV